MQGDINLLPGQLRVVALQIQERIKRRGRVRTEESGAQSGLAGFVNGQVLSFVPGISEACFPVPSLEVIGNPSHLTPQANVEELVPVSEFFMSGTGVDNTTKPNTRGYRETGPVRKEVWNDRICNRERIKRIRDWHADSGGTKKRAGVSVMKWVRRKRHRRQGRIEKRAGIFEIAKHR